MRSELFNEHTTEKEGDGLFVRQNSKMMKAELSQGGITALAGSMVAYQGNVNFEHQGAGGVKQMLKKAVTGEGLPLMRVTGTGEVFLANMGADVHVMTLENESVSINGQNILAYSDGLQSDIQMLRGGGGIMAGGLFNTTLTGSGQVAITTDGSPLVLETSGGDTYVDPDAAVCWAANLQIGLNASIGMKSLIGRASGEEFQLHFQGQGWVVVQPSENMRFGGAKDQGEKPGQGLGLGNLLR